MVEAEPGGGLQRVLAESRPRRPLLEGPEEEKQKTNQGREVSNFTCSIDGERLPHIYKPEKKLNGLYVATALPEVTDI